MVWRYLPADAAPAAEHRNSQHRLLPFSRNLYYSLWYYSTDRSIIGLRMQEHRRSRKSPSAEIVFGRVLRDIRRDRGLSQEGLAFESGYHPTYIGQLERGQKSPSLRTILNLAAVLQIPGSEILRRVEGAMEKVR